MNYKKLTKVQAKTLLMILMPCRKLHSLILKQNGKNTVWTILILHIPT